VAQNCAEGNSLPMITKEKIFKRDMENTLFLIY